MQKRAEVPTATPPSLDGLHAQRAALLERREAQQNEITRARDRVSALEAELRRVEEELTLLDSAIATHEREKAKTIPSTFDGANFSTGTREWLRHHGINQATKLQNAHICTPKAFLGAANGAADIPVFDEIAQYCAVVNSAWTEGEVQRIRAQLLQKLENDRHST